MIPSTLQERILKDFHAGHLGSNRMKSLMHSFVYWPNMDKDIENAVKLCKGCAPAAKTLLIKFNSWPKTDLPWSRIHIDIVGPLEGFYYFKVHRCKKKQQKKKKTTTEITIKFLHELFASFGLVDTTVANHGS